MTLHIIIHKYTKHHLSTSNYLVLFCTSILVYQGAWYLCHMIELYYLVCSVQAYMVTGSPVKRGWAVLFELSRKSLDGDRFF